MSDTSPAIPESIDPANQHKALTTGQQAVIKKLFRRLIVFLFVLFIFSFLDRINIGFAGLTMGRDLGLSATMFGLATTLFYAAYVIFGIPSNIMLSIVGARRWIATIMVLWGIASTATMFATGPTSLYVLRILVGITEAGFLPGSDAGSARGSHQPPCHATTQHVAGDLHSGGDDVYPGVFLPDQHT